MAGVTCLALAALAVLGSGCGGDDDEGTTAATPGPSVEYQVARVVRGFLVAYTEGDSERACGRLTAGHRQAVARRQGRPSCARGLSLERARVSNRALDRLRRARITKVHVADDAAKAEVTMRSPDRTERLTAALRRAGDTWQIVGDLMPGGLASGRVPKPPPDPPRNPEEERRIIAAFEGYRDAIARRDGRRACALQTPAARESLVNDAVELLGGERAAVREFGALDCEHVAVGFEVPAGRIKRVVVEGDRGRLTLEGGAKYLFRKLDGGWKLDS